MNTTSEGGSDSSNPCSDECSDCPPSYQEAVALDAEFALVNLCSPPAYDAIFRDGTEDVMTRDGSPFAGESVETPCPAGVATQNVFETLDREVQWTALSVGLLVAVLVVLILVIIIIVIPRGGSR